MAIRAGMANLHESYKRRPLLRPDTEKMMTDFAADAAGAIDRRSAALWAHEIKVPTILFHGSDDWRVQPDDALDVARGLLRAKTPAELHLYQGDTHAMTLNEADMIERAGNSAGLVDEVDLLLGARLGASTKASIRGAVGPGWVHG